MARYFRVKNFEQFQHYKDRSPPWIKLYNSLLDDYEFSCLQDASKLHLILIWLLASKLDNRLPLDAKWIANKINATEPVDIDLLLDAGFLVEINDVAECKQAASNALADNKQPAIPETEGETETEGEGEKKGAAAPPACPHQEIIELYHETLPALPRVKAWTDERQALLRSRWREDPKRQDLDWWRKFFGYVSQSDFLMGRAKGRGDAPPFMADLEWLIRPKNFVKVIEGKYENREVA